jgi:hypothetical protein
MNAFYPPPAAVSFYCRGHIHPRYNSRFHHPFIILSNIGHINLISSFDWSGRRERAVPLVAE